MYAIDLGPRAAPVNDELLWWVSQETFDRAVDTAIEMGLVDGSYTALKEEASMYKGYSSFRNFPDILRALDVVAAKPIRRPNESDEHFDYYSNQLADYRRVYQNYIRLTDTRIDGLT